MTTGRTDRVSGRHRSGLPSVVAAVASSTILLASCSGADGSAAERSSPQRADSSTTTTLLGAPPLEWRDCDVAEPAEADLQCATLEVLIDRTDPDRGTLELEIARVEASGEPSERIGPLLMNPGGPGLSGIDFLASVASEMPSELRDRFDLVSWDPRGVARSTPVRCEDDATRDRDMEGDLTPDSSAEESAAVADQLDYVDACVAENQGLIRHMSTADVAIDMEAIRVAIGGEQANYLGFSYGTALGATYATMFPESVRATVLDSNMSPTADAIEAAAGQLAGMERVHERFVATCDADPACPLAGRSTEVVNELRARLDEEPMVVSTETGDRLLTRDLFDLGLISALYNPSIWSSLAGVIDALDDGGPGNLLLILADEQLGRNPDGTWDNSMDARAMTLCADSEDRPDEQDPADLWAAGDQLVADAELFGDSFRGAPFSCYGWPVPANPVPDWSGRGAPPILVIGTVGDPATPYEWSEQMADALEGSVLLTWEGDGHWAFTRGMPCIDDAVVSYLVDITLPAEGTRCPAG